MVSLRVRVGWTRLRTGDRNESSEFAVPRLAFPVFQLRPSYAKRGTPNGKLRTLIPCPFTGLSDRTRSFPNDSLCRLPENIHDLPLAIVLREVHVVGPP